MYLNIINSNFKKLNICKTYDIALYVSNYIYYLYMLEII